MQVEPDVSSFFATVPRPKTVISGTQFTTKSLRHTEQQKPGGSSYVSSSLFFKFDLISLKSKCQI